MEVLFKTIHGSRLYGLSHKDSDYDYYVVVDKRPHKLPIQVIEDGIDTHTFELGEWIDQCQRGTPQALEAMFSTKATVDKIPELRANYTCGTHTAHTFLRVIRSLRGWDDFKHKRHMFRLAYEVRDMRKTGRFDPTLTDERVEKINRWAKEPLELVYQDALTIAFQ